MLRGTDVVMVLRKEAKAVCGGQVLASSLLNTGDGSMSLGRAEDGMQGRLLL